MKVTLISNSDSVGGAAVVTRRLMHALRREGIDARMLVNSRLTDDPYVEFAGTRVKRSFSFMKERARIMIDNGLSRSDLFKVSTADSGLGITSNPLVRDADIIVLGWINQGLMSLKDIQRICEMGKPVVWVMHDMWCLTGICHHAYDCRRYEVECGRCPYLHSDRDYDLSHKIWRKKERLYTGAGANIHFVAVSSWLARKCKESSLLKDRDVEVIPNAFPIDSFSIHPQRNINISTLDYDKNIILMGAARLDDPIKGLNYAVDALNEIFQNHPRVAQESLMVFFGKLRDKSALDKLKFPFQTMGVVNDPHALCELYALSKVVLSTSLYETLPGTLIEGQAAGALPVTFGYGGQCDIVEHKQSGYIAEYKDSHSVAEGILWALESPIDRSYLHNLVRERFAASAVARRYIELFNRLLKK